MTSSMMNQRTEELLRRAERISQSTLPPRQKRLLVEAFAIPVSWCGCLWNLPRVDLQVKAANTVVGALWGKRRKMRAKEVVLGVIHDPTRVDPTSSLVYRRLLDARRALSRSPDRLLHATHVNEMLDDCDDPPALGPVRGMRRLLPRWEVLSRRRRTISSSVSTTASPRLV